jgi:histone deacetylase complex regulatory component SIN3
VFSDTKSQDLYNLLKKERENVSLNSQDEADYKKDMEKIVGDADHLFQVDWVRSI